MGLPRLVSTAATMLLILSASPARAAHPLISDDAGTIGRGTVQIELNCDIGSDKSTAAGTSATTHIAQVATTIGYGATDTIDLNLGITRPWGSTDIAGTTYHNAGSTDYSIAMKWRGYEHDGFSVAVKPSFTLSTAVGNKDNYNVASGMAVVCTRELEPIALHLNAGYTYISYHSPEVSAASKNSIWNFSLAATYELFKERLKLATDFGVNSNQERGNDKLPAFALAGIIYTINKNVDISTGIKFGLNDAADDITGTFGLTLTF